MVTTGATKATCFGTVAEMPLTVNAVTVIGPESVGWVVKVQVKERVALAAKPVVNADGVQTAPLLSVTTGSADRPAPKMVMALVFAATTVELAYTYGISCAYVVASVD